MRWLHRDHRDRQDHEERRDQTSAGVDARRQHDEERQVTDPAQHAAADERLQRALARAKELTDITAVVTIRQPKKR